MITIQPFKLTFFFVLKWLTVQKLFVYLSKIFYNKPRFDKARLRVLSCWGVPSSEDTEQSAATALFSSLHGKEPAQTSVWAAPWQTGSRHQLLWKKKNRHQLLWKKKTGISCCEKKTGINCCEEKKKASAVVKEKKKLAYVITPYGLRPGPQWAFNYGVNCTKTFSHTPR